LKQGRHIKIISIFAVLFLWALAHSALAEEKNWQHWQKKYNLSRANKADSFEERFHWQIRPLEIKELDVTATLPDYPYINVSNYRGYVKERCLTCHDGIADTGPGHPRSFGCTVCHGGDGNAISETEAHKNLIYDSSLQNDRGNPSSIKIVEKTCGQLYCHAGHDNTDRNHIKRVKKSMMGNLAGIFSGLRYQWGGQVDKTARYGLEDIEDKDGNTPYSLGALNELKGLPHFPNRKNADQSTSVKGHISDSLLRGKCMQCHIDGKGSNKIGFRSEGCAACHVDYDKDGLYRGDDPTQSKTRPGKPAFHRIKALPDGGRCVQCHQTYALSLKAPEENTTVSSKDPEMPDQDAASGDVSGMTEKKNENPPEEDTVIVENGGKENTIDTAVMADNPVEENASENEALEDNSAFSDHDDSMGNPLEQTSRKTESPHKLQVERSIFKVNASRPAGTGEARTDVHFQKGFDCIDCHTQFDIMGDGNIYSKQHQAVEIRCETCHGDNNSQAQTAPVLEPANNAIRLSRHYKNISNYPGERMAVTAKSNSMSNVKEEEGNIAVYEKRSGRRHIAPQIKGHWAHSIPGHSKKLECTACHSQWTPKCEGCHTDLDQSKATPENHFNADWGPIQFKMKLETPALMIGPRGKAAPVLPQPLRKATLTDEKGSPLPAIDSRGTRKSDFLQWNFSNARGYSGSNLAYSLDPHSTQRQVRSCADCHINPVTLGLGNGDIILGKNTTGRNDKIESIDQTGKISQKSDHSPFAKTTLKGQILAGSNQHDSRPFNQKEITRILKVGNCLPCHDQYNDPIFQNMRKSYAFANTVDHQNLRKQILEQMPSAP